MNTEMLFSRRSDFHPQARNLYISLGGVGMEALKATKLRVMRLLGCKTAEEPIENTSFLAIDADMDSFRDPNRGMITQAECILLGPEPFSHFPVCGSGQNIDFGAQLLEDYREQLKEKLQQRIAVEEIPFDEPQPMSVHIFVGMGGGMSGALLPLLSLCCEVAARCHQPIMLFSYCISEQVLFSKVSPAAAQCAAIQENRKKVFAKLKERYLGETNALPCVLSEHCHLIQLPQPAGTLPFDETMQTIAAYAGEFLFEQPHQTYEKYLLVCHSVDQKHRFAAFGAKALHYPRKELMAYLGFRALEKKPNWVSSDENLDRIAKECGIGEKMFGSLTSEKLADLGIQVCDVRREGCDGIRSRYDQQLGRAMIEMLSRAEQLEERLYHAVKDSLDRLFCSIEYGSKAVCCYLKDRFVPQMSELRKQVQQRMFAADEAYRRSRTEWEAAAKEIQLRGNPLFHMPLYERFLYEIDTSYQARYRYEVLYRIRAMLDGLIDRIYGQLDHYRKAAGEMNAFYADLSHYAMDWKDTLFERAEAHLLIDSYLDANRHGDRYRAIAEGFLFHDSEEELSGKLRSACQLSAHNTEEVLQAVYQTNELGLQNCVADVLRGRLVEQMPMLYPLHQLQDSNVYDLNSPAQGVFSEAVHPVCTPAGPYYGERGVKDDICVYRLSAVKTERLAEWER